MDRKNSLLPLWPVCLALALAACQHQPATPATAASTESTEATRPFPADSLLGLLTAEMALNRGQTNIALAGYYQQAFATRDLGVTRRAVLLANHLQAGQAVLDLAQLWSSLEPENPEPVYLACQQLIAFQQPDAAMLQSRRLLSLAAPTLFVPIASSARLQTTDRQQRLLDEYDQLLRTHPDNTDLLLGRAVLQELLGQLPASLASAQTAISKDGDNLQARLFEVDLLYKNGKQALAVRRMASLVEDDPQNERLRLQYARLLSEQDLVKAREQFDVLATQNPQDADLLLARALTNYRLQDFAQASEQFTQLLALQQHSDTAHYYLGEIALGRGDQTSALRHYRSVSAGSEYLPACVRLFGLFVQQNRLAEGQQWLSEQRNLHPELAVRLYLIEADVLLQHGDKARSLAALDAAIAGSPEQAGLYYARSLLYDKLGNDRAAEADLRTVLRSQPDNVDALNALGYVLANNNRSLDEAYRLIARALVLRPDDPAILDSMGWVLYRQGKHEEAALRLQRAFALYPNDEVAAHLGEVLWMQGKRADAEKIWRQGLSLNPASALIPATRQRLAAP